MKLWVLMWYGVGECDCHGVVNSQELVDKWIAAAPYENGATEFTLNEIAWPSWCNPANGNSRK